MLRGHREAPLRDAGFFHVAAFSSASGAWLAPCPEQLAKAQATRVAVSLLDGQILQV